MFADGLGDGTWLFRSLYVISTAVEGLCVAGMELLY